MNKYKIQHDGQTFKRTSAARTYTHCVLVKVDHKQTIKHSAIAAALSYDREESRHREVIAGTYRHMQYADVKFSRAIIEGGRDAFVAAERARIADKLEREFPGRDHHWMVAGWCGSGHLAAKLSASSGGIAIEVTP